MNKRIWGLTSEEIAQIRNVLSAHPQVQEAVIYGSRAKGSYRAGSDIDLTLKGALSWTDLQEIETQLDDLDLPYQIDLSIESGIENQALRKHIETIGQKLYEKPATSRDVTRNP